MKANEKMTALMKNGAMPSEDDILKIDARLDKLFAKLRRKDGCLYLGGEDASPENFRDRTEFEAWHNEVLINAEFPKSTKVTAGFAVMFFAQFNARLTEEHKGKICAVLSEDDGRFTYRYHLVREEDGLWLSEDIEKFAQPILYDIFGGEDDEL